MIVRPRGQSCPGIVAAMKLPVASAALSVLLAGSVASAQPCARPNELVADLGLHGINVGFRL